MSYVLKCHEDIACVSKWPFRRQGTDVTWVAPESHQGGPGCLRVHGDPSGMQLKQRHRRVCRFGWGGLCEDSIHHSYISILEIGLSRHRQISQDTFLFLGCNNLTGIDKMKYILESLLCQRGRIMTRICEFWLPKCGYQGTLSWGAHWIWALLLSIA